MEKQRPSTWVTGYKSSTSIFNDTGPEKELDPFDDSNLSFSFRDCP